jgi:NADH-quinone oxidoreductase subunit A
MPVEYYPVLLAFAVALLVGTAILGLAALAGRGSGGRVKLQPYESGMPLLDRARKRMSIAFFLIAIDFVVFDVEAAFLYPWALVVREGGWALFWAVVVFILLIVVGFAYVWRKGGLDIVVRRPLEGAAP